MESNVVSGRALPPPEETSQISPRQEKTSCPPSGESPGLVGISNSCWPPQSGNTASSRDNMENQRAINIS